jgi:flagellar basal-body rod modification protein FlgD
MTVAATNPLDAFIAQQQASLKAKQDAEKAQTSTTGLGGNFQTFLKILTTQLTHQDPLSATDTNQFTQQLVQFANVEQQINTNNNLTKLINLQTSSALSTGLGYIGNYVAAVSNDNTLALQSSKSEVAFNLSGAAKNMTVKVIDGNDNVIRTFTGAGINGTNYVAWDGKASDGTQMPDGLYRFEVTAKDSLGEPVTVTEPRAIAKVTAVQIGEDGMLQVICGSLAVSDKDIDAVFSTDSLPNPTLLPAT